MEASKKKSPSPIAWVLGQAGPHRYQFVLSVVLAVLGVAFSVAPYFAVVGIVKGLMAGERNLSYYLIQAGLIALMWLGRVLCHAFSTATSHRATFAVLGEIRKRCTEKLTRMPLGTVLQQSSGALKNTLIERIDSIETTLAHIVPEFTANLLIPVIITVYIFTIDWRMGLASLATVPLGMFFYIWMMATSAGFYQATIDNTKALNNTAVEYINGIQVIKVFGKTKSSYERFVKDAHAAAGAFIGWMRASIIPFTFAMVVMPATMVSVLPIGGLLVKGGTLSGQDFITVIILSVGLITPLITLMSYSDDIRTMGTIFGEVQAILDAPEQERPATGDAPKGNDLKLEDVHFSTRRQHGGAGGQLRGAGGSFRQRQEHHRPADRGAVGCERRQHIAGREGHSGYITGSLRRPGGLRQPGQLPVQHDRSGEHPPGPPRRDGRRGGGCRQEQRLPRVHTGFGAWL